VIDAGRCRARERAEALAWMADADAAGPFAFSTICDTLGIDARPFRVLIGVL
jgi:hypothetical protein